MSETAAIRPHVVRMMEEERELAERVLKLGEFIATNEQYTHLSIEKQSLMRAQLNAMRQYLNVLRDRILLEKE